MKQARKPTAIHLMTAVWGEEHTSRFLEFAVPSELGQGNLAALAELAPLEYHVYTRREDEMTMRGSESFRRIAEHARLSVHVLTDEMIAGHPHAAMTRTHQDILSAAHARDEPVVFLSPEVVLAQGSLAMVARRVAEGTRLILGLGVRLETTVAGTIKERFTCHGTIEAPPRQLVSVALSHLHPMMQALFWDAPQPTNYPSGMLWHVGDDGVLAHCFHLHPLLVWPDHEPLLSGTIDDRLVDDVCSPEAVYISQDSDELFIVTIDDKPSGGLRLLDTPADPWRIAVWAVEATGSQHRRQVVVPIRLHTRDLDQRWQRAEHEAAQIVRQIRRRLRFLVLVGYPAWRRLRGLAARNPVLHSLYQRIKRKIVRTQSA